MPSPLVIFDLDGTLVDTAPDLMASLNHVLESQALAPVEYKDINFLVGQGALAMIERAYALHDTPLDKGELPALFDRFIAHYLAEMPGKSGPFPGVVEALSRLKEAGFSLAVCTNKFEAAARALLDALELTPWFDAISGGDTFSVKKPHGAHVLGTIGLAGGQFPHAVMIGDSINDIKAAANAGIPSIAVPFGYSDVPVETLNPSHIIDHFDALTPALIEELLARA